MSGKGPPLYRRSAAGGADTIDVFRAMFRCGTNRPKPTESAVARAIVAQGQRWPVPPMLALAVCLR